MVGKEHRLIQDRWTLNDKAFKELDVWNFDYPNQDDRQLAINCALSAFDRMRSSTQEKVWDMLLPKNERGKGKILSNLDLHKGPIKQSNTPRIQDFLGPPRRGLKLMLTRVLRNEDDLQLRFWNAGTPHHHRK